MVGGILRFTKKRKDVVSAVFDNDSGHYKPSFEDMIHLINFFETQMNISKEMMDTWEVHKAVGSPTEIHTFAEFLQQTEEKENELLH